MIWLEELREQGYQPKTLLDVGAHLGAFSNAFVSFFPECLPTLVEPNPHCALTLKEQIFNYYMFAASNKEGPGYLYLTKEWLQTTGASLYRENTIYFRDEVLIKLPIHKARIDDVFKDFCFDFVKIDTQGSELDVLLGGEKVFSKAEYILIETSLVEYNLGGARIEDVFLKLRTMGFGLVEATEFHRFPGMFNGNVFQIDFLFKRKVDRS